MAGLRVMVVEDNELNRQVVAGFLRHLGAEVELFPAGAPALARLAAARFDVALLDLQLDRENGLELAQAMRATPAGAALPLVFLSAHFEEEDRMTATGLGALACLTKPFDPDELRAPLAPLGHEQAVRAPAPAPALHGSLRTLFARLWPGHREAIERAGDTHALRRAAMRCAARWRCWASAPRWRWRARWKKACLPAGRRPRCRWPRRSPAPRPSPAGRPTG
ncbi:MAG: response regulator [Rubrivivax sp.]